MNFIVIDLETTGLNPTFDEIIEIGAVKIVDGLISDTFQTFVKPTQILSDEVSDLTGITQEMLSDAPSLSTTIQELSNFAGDTRYWVAHNKDFEASFLNPLLDVTPFWLDTIEIAKIILPTERYFRLGKLLEIFHIEHKDLHRALVDAQGTAELLLILQQRLTDLPDKLWQEFLQISLDVHAPLADWLRFVFSERVGHGRIYVDNAISDLNSTVFGQSIDNDEPDTTYQLPIEQIEDFFLNLPNERYEVRSEQIKMSQMVGEAFNKGQLLLAEAGTGTGKSLAYLLPAVLYSLGSKQQVVISTNTINLQEQLLQKDIPLLGNELAEHFYSVVLKGRGNYLCHRKWQQMKSEVTADTLALFLRVAHWLTITGTGDFSEMNLWGREAELMQRMSAVSESCINFNCKFNRATCFVTKVRRKAAHANLLIINHSLLLTASFLDEDGGNILPPVRHLIIDEAHQLPAVAQRQFSQNFSAQIVRHTLNMLWQRFKPNEMLQSLKKLSPQGDVVNKLQKVISTHDEIAPTCRVFDDITNSLFYDTGADLRYLRIEKQRNDPELWQPVEEVLSNLFFELKQFYIALGELLNDLGETDDPYFSVDAVAAFQAVRCSISELLSTAQIIIDGRNIQSNEDCVIWLEKSAYWEHGQRIENIQWWVAPTDIRPLLNRYIYQDKRTIVLTSATMTNNDFSYFSRELGLEYQKLPIKSCILPSPFNYQENARLFLANDIADYTKSSEIAVQQQLAEAIFHLVVAAKGRTLVLFTSYQQLNGVYSVLRPMLRDSNIQLLAHGISGGRNFIIESMHQNPNICVLGVNSFWEGVDIKGDNLSLLIIVRLPFAPPNSPILEAKFELIKQNGGNPFREYSLPQAVIRFKQGFGRLIRSKEDRGVCCVLDQRIWNQKNYGKKFLDALPQMPTKCCSIAEMEEEISRFLR